MDNQEIKSALFNENPVEYNGIIYKCVSGIIYRNRGGKLSVSVELKDKLSNSVTIADPKRINKITEEE